MSAYKNGYPPTSCVNFSIALIAETASYLKSFVDLVSKNDNENSQF